MIRSIPPHSLVLAAIIALVFSACSAAEPKPTDDELLAGADARIEKHRKADAAIIVVDAAGKPVPGAKIEVAQTRHAFLFGSNIFVWGKVGNPQGEAAYRQRFAALLNYATLPFYWPMYEPKQGQPNHEYAKQVAMWCKEQGIAAKGHPLAWNFADPGWLPDDPAEVHRLQMARIDDCVARFTGLIDRWDVVNEVTHYDRDEFLKKSPKQSATWKKYGPIEFTRECFVHARQANPKSTLLINDYRTDPPYEKVIEQLVDKDGKRLYDVIGIQSHMHGGAWTSRNIWTTCQRFARFGVPLHFTEATVLSGHRGWEKPKDAATWDSTPEGEADQAREVARFYTMLFSHPAVEAITWWDFSDLHAWKAAPAGFVRKDMSPKPVYDELMKLIKGKWWTNASLTGGADGKATLRGILGDYKVTVAVPGKPVVVKEYSLKKGAKNEWQVTVP